MGVKVVIAGAAGRMGRVAVECLNVGSEFEIVGCFGRAGQQVDHDFMVETDIDGLLDRSKPAVLLELTNGANAPKMISAAIERGIHVVVGSTGLSTEYVNQLAGQFQSGKYADTGVLQVPNFSIGAVLMMQFAEIASAWLPDAEIIELHHDRKVDAPSGTALRTAELMERARKRSRTTRPEEHLKIPGARGGEFGGVPIHSIRLPGLLAHQEVIFGGTGEVLTLRHDSLDRSSFAFGIRLAVARVGALRGLHIGLENVLTLA